MLARNSLFIFLIAVVLQSNCLAQNLAQTVSDIDAYLSGRVEESSPGMSALVMKDDSIVLRKAYGLANLETNKPLTTDNIFRIGSITKQFTSMAILKLVQEGKINLNDPITRFLPTYPVKDKIITVEHLLNHTSGIKSYTSLFQVVGGPDTKAKSYRVQEMIDLFKNEPMDFAPGENYLYNNSGYFLLGAIVEKASGMTWGNYLKKTFFTPLNLQHTYTDDPKLPDVAKGYNKFKAYAPADYVHPSAAYAAGAIYSTVDDLWKWNKAVFSYSLVSKEFLERAWTPLTLKDGSRRNYGYGWQLGRIGDKRVIGHGGTIDGYQSFSLYVPEANVYVAILSNNMSMTPEEYCYRVAAMAMNALESPAGISLTEKELDEYVGVYEITAQEKRNISRKGNKLFSLRTGGTLTEIIPYEKDKFYISASPVRFYFKRNAAGQVESMELLGREYIVPTARKTNTPLPKERVAIPLDEKKFDRYAGEYELVPGFNVKVFREGKTFFSQATGQSSIEMAAEAETKFFLKTVDAQIEFVKNDNGDFNTLILTQGGRVIPGKRIGTTSGSPSVEKKERKEIKLNPALLKNYEGEFQFTPQFKIVVKKQDTKLFAQATGQSSFEIFPESELKFFYKAVDAQIEFVKGGNGKIVRMILHQNGQSLPGEKIK